MCAKSITGSCKINKTINDISTVKNAITNKGINSVIVFFICYKRSVLHSKFQLHRKGVLLRIFQPFHKVINGRSDSILINLSFPSSLIPKISDERVIERKPGAKWIERCGSDWRCFD